MATGQVKDEGGKTILVIGSAEFRSAFSAWGDLLDKGRVDEVHVEYRGVPRYRVTSLNQATGKLRLGKVNLTSRARRMT